MSGPTIIPSGSTEGQSPSGDGQQPADPFAGITTEGRPWQEIDAEYRSRLGGHQRGWNAEREALREQNTSLQQEVERLRAGATSGGDGQSGDQGRASRSEIERLNREIEQRDTLYGRKAKFPSLHGNVSDAVILASDEPELARLNALFDTGATPGADGQTPFIAPTAPRRSAAPSTKRIEDMTKEELLVALKRSTDRMTEERGF